MKSRTKTFPKGFNIAKMDSFPNNQQDFVDEELVKHALTGIQADLNKKLSMPEA